MKNKTRSILSAFATLFVLLTVLSISSAAQLLPLPTPFSSSQAAIEGYIVDAEGTPIEAATVSVAEEPALNSISAGNGYFLIDTIPVDGEARIVTISVAAEGYGQWIQTNAAIYPNTKRILGEIKLSQMNTRVDAGGVPSLRKDTLITDELGPRIPRNVVPRSPVPSTIRVAITGYADCNPWQAAGYPVQSVVTLDLKSYIKGVLPNEWRPDWPIESLRAGAFAAKQVVWWTVNVGKWSSLGFGFDISDTTCDQVYRGNSEQSSTNAAVDHIWSSEGTYNGNPPEVHYLAYDWQCQQTVWPRCMGQYGTRDKANAGMSWQQIVHAYYDPITITGDQSSLAPFYANIVQNAGFDSGGSSWASEFSTPYAVYSSNGQFTPNSYLAFHGTSGQPMGVIWQTIPYAANAGDILDMRLDLANISFTQKHLRVHLHNPGDWNDALVCDFYIPPDTNRLEHYTLRRKITTNWSSMRIWVEVKPADNAPDIWMDAVNVRRLPSNALALTGTECHAPTAGTDWDFTGTNGPQGWSSVGNQFSELSQQANGTRFKVTGDDAWLEGPTMTNVNAASYKYFNVEMATTSNTCGQILFQPRGNIWFGGTHTVDFVPVTDGTMRVYSINMQSNPNWTGAISQFRFDPNCNSGFNGSAGNYVTIKRIWLSNTIPNPPTVTLSGSPSATEGGTLNYTLNVSPTGSSAITVNFTVSGTATSGTDYTDTGSVVIPANANTAALAINTLDDASDEPNETVIATLTTASGAGAVLGSQIVATGTIVDNDLPLSMVTISGTPSVTEGQTLNFTLNVSPASPNAITVSFTTTGTATSGNDYTSINSLVIPANASNATLTINTIHDTTDEPNETVVVELTTVSGIASAIGTPKTATGTIINSSVPPSTVTLTGMPSVTEGGILTFTVSVNEVSTSAITANLSFSGTATSDGDYTAITSLVIPANASSATLSLSTIDDNAYEASETVTVTVNSVTAAAVVGVPNIATGTIVDNDPPLPSAVTLSGTPSTAEGGVLTFDLSVNPVSATPLTVNLWVGGSATSGTDYIPLLNPITIPANTANYPLAVTLLADANVEGDETVVIALLGVSSGGSIGSPNTATGTIAGDPLPPPSELLENGGFDIKPAAQWIIQPKAGTLLNDKVKCDKAGLPPISDSAPCAFLFKGGAGESTVLRQIRKFPSGTFMAGDALLFKYQFNATGKPSAIAKVTVTFFGGGKQNITTTIKEFGATGGIYVNRESLETVLLNPTVTKIVVKFVNRSLSGKLYIDSVSLLHVQATDRTLPVPEMP